MAFYEELVRINLVRPISDPLGKGQIEWDANRGKFKVKLFAKAKRAYYNASTDLDRFCPKGFFYFDYYGIIRRNCRKCWKVVHKMDRLSELMKAKTLIDDLVNKGINAKCGVENRPTTRQGGRYSIYFYAPMTEDVEEAKKFLKKIRRLIGDREVFMKRGCTEFERAFPPSSKWDEYAEKGEWDKREALLDSSIEFDRVTKSGEWQIFTVDIIQNWIEWAFELGDEEYLNYVEGPFFPPYERYDYGTDFERRRTGETSGESAEETIALI